MDVVFIALVVLAIYLLGRLLKPWLKTDHYHKKLKESVDDGPRGVPVHIEIVSSGSYIIKRKEDRLHILELGHVNCAGAEMGGILRVWVPKKMSEFVKIGCIYHIAFNPSVMEISFGETDMMDKCSVTSSLSPEIMKDFRIQKEVMRKLGW